MVNLFSSSFKTHFSGKRLTPKAQRHIVVIRNHASLPRSNLYLVFSCYGSDWMANDILDNVFIKQRLFKGANGKKILCTKRVKVYVTDLFDKNCENGDKTLGPW